MVKLEYEGKQLQPNASNPNEFLIPLTKIDNDIKVTAFDAKDPLNIVTLGSHTYPIRLFHNTAMGVKDCWLPVYDSKNN